MLENPNFLKNKYNLHTAPEVDAAAKRAEKRTGEKVSQDPQARIQNYLDRLEKLIIDPDKKQARRNFGKESRPRALSLLREMVMDEYVRPNKQKMAEGAAAVEERAARTLGMELQYGEEELAQRGEIAVIDLEKSLDNWIAYLSDANEPYPTWFRYYAFRNILNLGDFDKDKKEFVERSKGSTRLFPEIDRGALAYVQERIQAANDPKMLEKLIHAQRTAANNDIPANELLTAEKAKKFSKLSFAKQYAEGISQAGEITPEMRKITDGKWVKYQKGTDPTALWASLQNKGTAWCTKGFATAETQMQGGDFYVYYTLDKHGKSTIPRIAIRMQGENIGEVRGVADGDQNLEGNMAEIAQTKLNEFPNGAAYEKKSQDMKGITKLAKKQEKDEAFTKDELVFLYEINSQIEGFGYQRDPRIKEIRDQRKQKEDAPIVFECNPAEIAWKKEEINEKTKAYVGPLFEGIFQKNIENIYTRFPEGRVEEAEMEIGGKSAEDLARDIKQKKDDQGRNYQIYSNAESMLKNPDFEKQLYENTDVSREQWILKNSEQIKLVRLKVGDLGFTKNPTTDELYAKTGELGLELCPAEVGPNLRLKYAEVFKREQSMNEYLYIAMKQITGSGGSPRVFDVGRDGDGFWLRSRWTSPTDEWSLDDEFVFRLRKPLKP